MGGIWWLGKILRWKFWFGSAGFHNNPASVFFLELFIRVDLIGCLFGNNIQVVFLQEAEVLTGLREFAFFHTLPDVPVDEGTLAVHHVILLRDTFGEDTRDGHVVSNHGHVSLGLGHDVLRDRVGRDLVQADLETGRAPLHEGDLVVLLEPLNGGVGLLGFDLSTVVDGDGHVLVFHRVKVGVLDKHVLRLEDVVCDFTDSLGLVRGLLLGDDWGQGRSHEVEAREGHKVGLEFSEVHIQLSVESERGGHGGNDLGDDFVQVIVRWSLDVKLLLADAVDSFVVEKHRHFSVVQEPVGREHGVVRLNDASGNLGGRVDLEADLRLLSVVNSDALEDQGAETRAGTTANSVVDDEALHVLGVVHQLSQPIVDLVKDFLSHCVVATGKVVGGVLLSIEQEFGVEHLRLRSCPDIVNDSRLEIDGDVTGHELASACLLVKRREVLVFLRFLRVFLAFAVVCNFVFRTVLDPHSISQLDTSLTNINGKDFAGWHGRLVFFRLALKTRKEPEGNKFF